MRKKSDQPGSEQFTSLVDTAVYTRYICILTMPLPLPPPCPPPGQFPLASLSFLQLARLCSSCYIAAPAKHQHNDVVIAQIGLIVNDYSL